MYEYREFTMKTIVVATDFAGTSYGAINYAKQLAICFSAKILLVHVVDSKPSALPAKQVAPREALRRRLIFGLRWEHGEAEAFLENYVGNGHGCWLDWPLAAAVFRSRNTLRPERGESSAM